MCYAVGWTQHSDGVQIIRAAAILQLLLGNIGRPGGGILALRGHASIQVLLISPLSTIFFLAISLCRFFNLTQVLSVTISKNTRRRPAGGPTLINMLLAC